MIENNVQKKKFIFKDSTTLGNYLQKLNENLKTNKKTENLAATLGMNFCFLESGTNQKAYHTAIDENNLKGMELISSRPEKYTSFFYPAIHIAEVGEDTDIKDITIRLDEHGDLLIPPSKIKYKADLLDKEKISKITASHHAYECFPNGIIDLIKTLTGYGFYAQSQIETLKQIEDVMRKTGDEIYSVTRHAKKERFIHGITERAKNKIAKLFTSPNDIDSSVD